MIHEGVRIKSSKGREGEGGRRRRSSAEKEEEERRKKGGREEGVLFLEQRVGKERIREAP
jgi:hypothetical protein